MKQRLTVEFCGDVPQHLTIGDSIGFEGVLTVSKVEADVIDVTQFGGAHTDLVLGDTNWHFIGNHIKLLQHTPA